ncbi:MAG TPA: hypothetical protein VGG11_12800, partial [Xanthobacteraceae bacterium]
MAQQREQAAASKGTEDVKDDRQDRERRADAEAEKKHRNDVQILERKDENRGDEQNDNYQINPAHAVSPPKRMPHPISPPGISAAQHHSAEIPQSL